MHPDWLGSPQHFMAGVVLAALLTGYGLRRRLGTAVALLVGVGLTAAAETVVELAEYPLLYSGEPHVTAYYDTLVDLAATLAGAIVGSAVVAVVAGVRASKS